MRARLVLLLQAEELSVAELQEITGRGQSQISTHLAQLKQAGLVEDRRTGKNSFYRLRAVRSGEEDFSAQLLELVQTGLASSPEAEDDRAALRLVLEKRKDRMRSYFDDLAGRFGRQYLPGRSWQGLAEALLLLVPPMVIADLGAGEGTFSQMLARRAKQVIAVDSSANMVRFGTELAERHGVRNLEYRCGDMEELPIGDGEVDLAFFSQSLHHALHPERAVREAWRVLKPGGRIAILELLSHTFEQAREVYADVWLGFSEVEIRRFLTDTGFEEVQSALVHRETEPPHFQTILAVAEKPKSLEVPSI